MSDGELRQEYDRLRAAGEAMADILLDQQTDTCSPAARAAVDEWRRATRQAAHLTPTTDGPQSRSRDGGSGEGEGWESTP